ncbi:hypothetical protein [Mycolicibacterium iranicum]|uniref:Secreted protein n=1 Tax=Mycolicibacterium iranicum TaxID=912594 RepID=A0A1X1WSZ0_MYCIR|nr:hypothetical protein [Mycolicibacterium iranicum]ORV89776.1 hypothetical protein AWC12_09060 [Mycolicibacterium iranicum]
MVSSRSVVAAVCVAAAGVFGASGVAAAQPAPPPPPPPPPNVNAYAPANPQDFAVYGGSSYAFTTAGLTCMVQRSGPYGCSGVLPGAPNGANLVSGRSGVVPGFGSVGGPIVTEPVNALPPNTRISFGTVSCGGDGTTTACVDSVNQSGFVVSPGATWVVNQVNPLVARPEGTNPYFN